VPDSNDLLLGIYRLDAEHYGVDLQFRRPDDNVDLPPERSRMKIDPGELKRRLTPERYGDYLTDCLFVQTGLGSKFELYRSVTQKEEEKRVLRLRVSIDRTADELHALRWETLRDPTDPKNRPWLMSSPDVLFSRFLASRDFRPVSLNRRGELRTLVAIANPTDLGTYRPDGQVLAEVDVAGELDRVQKALKVDPNQHLPGWFRLLASLPGSNAMGPPTYNNVIAELQRGIEILYLVCHGALVSNLQPALWLEKDEPQRKADVVLGDLLVDAVRNLVDRPRLVVLASCQSAGAGGSRGTPHTRSRDRGVLAALGPRLAEAGVPAVLAMQGNVLMDAIAQFMPAFFAEVQRHGHVDLAASVARNRIARRKDGWVPALFSRLRTGRIWYEPGLAGPKAKAEETWTQLLQSIKKFRCTPILGPGLIEPLVGSHRELAQRWADKEGFPMAPSDRVDLPQVAQYLATTRGQGYMRTEFLDQLVAEIRRRDPGLTGIDDADILISQAGAGRRERDQEQDPYWVLARLGLKTYITATPDRLLADALEGAGKHPEVELFRWNGEMARRQSVYDSEPKFRPTPDRPLVYHLFGRLDDCASLVITEDDYFNYLIAVAKAFKESPSPIPNVVSVAWTTHALLFLGFQLDDWSFRVLFRSMLQEGRKLLDADQSVAVQVGPEEGPFPNPDRARRYLERYYQHAQNSEINMYWGKAVDFLTELWSRRQEKMAVQTVAPAAVGVLP
jgi:hypothetical protein